MNNKELREVCHLFVYQICTGVEYCNIWSVFETIEYPGIGTIIKGNRGKNENPFYLPADPLALELLELYDYKLPRYTNDVYNKLIKIIAQDVLKIERGNKITTHWGRKTFAMLKKLDGWSTEAISTMLGHKSIRTTEIHYLAVSPDLIVNEMARRLNNNP